MTSAGFARTRRRAYITDRKDKTTIAAEPITSVNQMGAMLKVSLICQRLLGCHFLVQGSNPEKEANHGRYAHDVIEFKEIIRIVEAVAREVDPLRPVRVSLKVVPGNALFNPVAGQCHEIPQNEQDASSLDQSPASVEREVVVFEPVREEDHSDEKKNVSELVRIQPLRRRVRLKRKDSRGDEGLACEPQDRE
jgi:hypothetical protein